MDSETSLTKSIADTVADYRRAAGLTIAKFAELCDRIVGEPGRFKPNTMQALFVGKRKNLTVYEVLVFAKVLNVPPTTLAPALSDAGYRDRVRREVRAELIAELAADTHSTENPKVKV